MQGGECSLGQTKPMLPIRIVAADQRIPAITSQSHLDCVVVPKLSRMRQQSRRHQETTPDCTAALTLHNRRNAHAAGGADRDQAATGASFRQ